MYQFALIWVNLIDIAAVFCYNYRMEMQRLFNIRAYSEYVTRDLGITII